MAAPDRARDERRKPYLVNGMLPFPSGSTGMASHSSRGDLHAARMRDVHRAAEIEIFDNAPSTEEGNKRTRAYREKHGLDD